MPFFPVLTLAAAAAFPVSELRVPFGKHPDFDVAADERRRAIHLVTGNDGTLRYLQSRDGGRSWSTPERIPGAGRPRG